MSESARFAAPERTLSSQPASAPNETCLYGDIPAADVYREYFDGGMVLTHESREKVGSPEHSVRVEITERYEPGFSRRKLVAAETTRKELLTSVSIPVCGSPLGECVR